MSSETHYIHETKKRPEKYFISGKFQKNLPEKQLKHVKNHALVLRKEMSKTTNKNMCMIKQLMTVTYPF